MIILITEMHYVVIFALKKHPARPFWGKEYMIIFPENRRQLFRTVLSIKIKDVTHVFKVNSSFK